MGRWKSCLMRRVFDRFVEAFREEHDGASGDGRLSIPPPNEETHRRFTSEASGLAVRLPDWRCPLVCELPTGTLRYESFGGHWGDPRQLDSFLQGYAVEIATLVARRSGHATPEVPQFDGSVRFMVPMEGAAPSRSRSWCRPPARPASTTALTSKAPPGF